ncbi:MAG: 50S ribosomal protein L29 [Bryobacteraceae bacterium]
MKAEKFRGIDMTDLQRQVQDSHDQLFRFRFQMGMGQMEGLKKYRSLKKDRARMLTVLGEKHAAGETPAPAAPTKAASSGKSSDKRKR